MDTERSCETAETAAPLAVVLAAGKGTRMKSDLPKVLVPCLGRPLIDYVLDALQAARIDKIAVVVGYRAEDVRAALAARPGLIFVDQPQQLGTGHAVQMCRDVLLGHTGPTLILTGDSPMVQPSSLRKLLDYFHTCTRQSVIDARPPLACLLGTLYHPRPDGLGRIVRDAKTGEFLGIVEEKDATPDQRAIREVNMSTYVFRTPDLLWALDQLRNDNRQREYYLTDCPGILRRAGRRVEAMPVLQPCEALSVNTLEELALVEAELRRQMSGACEKTIQ
jgi:bifunctional UDP-N-acetylglucosamine pyrophosphorylase/glucosamine-1-phosphate N-acetyltransferase/UDP-N-acetylglucosamine pyrophosphorylase